MSRILRRAAVAAATVAMAAGIGTLVSPSAASAYSASALCGSGYHNIDHHNLTHNGNTIATIYLSYNGSRDCAVTIKNKYYGTKTWTAAWVGIQYGTEHDDSQYYSYYAGPVRLYAPGKCIYWGGEATYNKSTGAVVAYTSPNEHCG